MVSLTVVFLCANTLRQGTLPFVSLSVLRQVTAKIQPSNIHHDVADDLEAFFYVFTWICVLYDGPNGTRRTTRQDKSSIIHRWSEAGLRSTGGLLSAKESKTCFLYDPGDTVIDEDFTDYFRNLQPLAVQWRDLVKAEDARRVRINNGKSLPQDHQRLSHQTVISLLRQYVDDFSPSGDLASPSTPPIIPHPDSTQMKRGPESPPPSNLASTVNKKPRYTSDAGSWPQKRGFGGRMTR